MQLGCSPMLGSTLREGGAVVGEIIVSDIKQSPITQLILERLNVNISLYEDKCLKDIFMMSFPLQETHQLLIS